MKYYFTILGYSLFLCINCYAQQITITPSANPSELINTTFFNNCNVANNVVSNKDGSLNNINSYGYFENTNTNFPFNQGMVITSGNVEYVTTSNLLNSGDTTWTGSPTAEAVLGIENTYNATEITFEFTAQSDEILFNYIIASEEYYLENPCSFSDAYAILIKPTGSTDPFTNIAVVPNTDINANTNTIHNEIVGFCEASYPEYFDGYNIGATNFNGRTNVLQAKTAVIANTNYTIKFIVADVNDAELDSALFIEAFTPTSFIDLGDDLNVCDDSIILNGATGNTLATYQWFFNDALIAGANAPNFTAVQSGIYTLKASVLDCIIEDSVEVLLNANIAYTSPSNITECTNGDWNLNTSLLEIISSQSNLEVSFHTSEADAVSGESPISDFDYTTAIVEELIYVRITNTLNGCSTTDNFSVTLTDPPILLQSTTLLNACATDDTGISEFNLNGAVSDFITDVSDITILFFETLADATANINPIANTTSFSNSTINSQRVYVRFESTTTGCFSIGAIDLFHNYVKTNLNNEPYSVCDTDNDGTETYELDAVTGFLFSNVTIPTSISYYVTEIDRDNETNVLDPTITQIISTAELILYASINAENCTTPIFAEVEMNLEPITEFSSIGTIAICSENPSTFTSLDLTQTFTNLVVNGTPGFSVRYYLTEEDATVNSNSLPNIFTNINNPQLLYTRITNTNTRCYSVNQFSYNVLPAPQTNTIEDTIICDNDLDGSYNVNLITETQNLLASLMDSTISFYATENDATSGSNAITNPSNFITESTTIYIRVTNTDTNCFTIVPHSIYINTEPQLQPISPYIYCEDNSDGIGDFILANKDIDITGDIEGLNVLYFETTEDALNSTNIIDKNNNYQNIDNPQTISVRVEHLNDPSCYTIAEFELIVSSNPTYNEPSDMFLCDDITNDGFETFDLSEKAAEMSLGIADNLNFSFYGSYNDALTNTNTLPNNFTNTSNPQEIFARVDNGGLCQPITSFLIEVYLVADINQIQSLEVCDNDYDGLNTFDLTTTEDLIFNIRTLNIEVNYFETETDLTDNTNSITALENYNNLSNPQTIYVKVQNTISGCFFSFPLDLVVNPPPVINDFIKYEICESEAENIDLSPINTLVTENTFNKSYTYYLNLDDAIAQNNDITEPYNPATAADNLYVRVSNVNTDCYVIYPFVLQVNPNPIVQSTPNIEICDTNNDGIETILLETQNDLLLQDEDPSLFSVSYYTTLENAQNAYDHIPLIYNSYHDELIYARIENNATGCYTITNFNVILQPYPVLNLPPVIALCDNNGPLFINAQQATDNNTYLWSTGATTSVININETGNYWVTITSETGCTSEHYFEVISSSSATITSISISNFSPLNTISVTVEGNGDYIYTLDNGNLQDSSTFSNIAAGPHTLQVIDINGCDTLSIEVFVFNVPKFFTPNNDGNNDFWQIKGAHQLGYLELNIFDRFGKIIAMLNKDSRGWDGTLNGINLPSTDYWYNGSVVINGQIISLKGHFALIR